MTISIQTALVAGVLACGLWTAAAQAQEPSPYDRSKTITRTGVVTSFTLGAQIALSVQSAGVTYQLQGEVPDDPPQGGWTATSLHVGETVTVVLHPSRTDPMGGELVSVTTADGIRFATKRPQ